MKKYFLFIVALFICTLTFSHEETITFCNYGMELTVSSPKKFSVKKMPEYRNGECGIRTYVGCTRYLLFRRAVQDISFTVDQDHPAALFHSFVAAIVVNGRTIRLFKEQYFKPKMLIAEINIGNNRFIKMRFSKKQYDFAMEILKHMEIKDTNRTTG